MRTAAKRSRTTASAIEPVGRSPGSGGPAFNGNGWNPDGEDALEVGAPKLGDRAAQRLEPNALGPQDMSSRAPRPRHPIRKSEGRGGHETGKASVDEACRGTAASCPARILFQPFDRLRGRRYRTDIAPACGVGCGDRAPERTLQGIPRPRPAGGRRRTSLRSSCPASRHRLVIPGRAGGPWTPGISETRSTRGITMETRSS